MKNVPLLSLCAFLAICVLRLTESSANAQLSDSLANGLRLHFAFNGNATDSSSNGFNGTLVGPPSFVPDEQNNLNSAISLNGLGQYVSFTDQVFGPNVDSFSFFARVNVDPAKSGGIVMKGSQNGEAQLKIADGNFSFQVNTGTRWEYATFPATSGYKSLVGTYTRNSNIQLWVDGELKQQTPITNGSLWSNSGFYSAVGAYVHSAGSFEYFDGVIDEVRIYDRALNSSEIKVLSVPADASDLDQDGVIYYREIKDGTDPGDPTSFNPLSKGLVAYYSFNGDASDESGFQRNGTVQGAASATDRFGRTNKAYSFAGGGEHIRVDSPPDVVTPGVWTTTLWVKVAAGGVSSPRFVCNGTIDVGVHGNGTFVPFSGEHPAFGGGWGIPGVTSSHVLRLEQWYFIVVTYDGQKTKIYLNGSQSAESTESGGAPQAATFGLGIGRNLDTGGDSFAGVIDDIRIYDRALSASEINQVMNASGDTDGDELSDAWERGYGRYQIVQGSFTWQQAKTDAEAKGGHLATITSQTEQDFIVSLFEPQLREGRTGTWIGAYQTSKTDEPSGNWAWVNGEQWSYANWNVSPDNYQGNQDYGCIIGDIPGFSKWDDAQLAGGYTRYLLEFGYPTDPFNPDTDGDGLKDGAEHLLADLGFSPLDINSAQAVTLFSDPNKAFLFTQEQYDLNRANGQTDVTTSPSAFNLFTRQQFDSNRTAGQSDVISNPMSYGLYDNNSIMDLHMGGLMIQKQGNNAVVSFQPQTTADLTQPYTNYGLPITSTITMPGDKGFIRIQARPYPTPSGTPPIH